ncbi:sigma-54-dependent Fis family transcriptional regulator [Teredinibacter sp. KSP-S5-2]|uniref:sigma-54 interaction domain-containing protein n=1 Tax=Teredinibacter sp. KSP-S5-2 TaxID=3034506 RepID=UPI0029352A88|nr:sigma-54-dependent Fis family transcriptional regulator [Teredinibacter sp. KSP-S5-2]WNO10769.1 sigma-54-dependent Fis family transcriptional regulator [Teredinibacter sp. KSP-S5-2]
MTDTTILNVIQDPAILLDRNYRIIAANNAYLDEFNQRAVGHTCYQISHGYSVPCDQAGESCPLRQASLTGETQRVLHIHNTSHGKEHVDVELIPIQNQRGETEYFVERMKRINELVQHDSHMIGYTASFNQMLNLLNRGAKADISVLLLGESGTGKELAARYLHEKSARADQPFVTVECSGLTETLFESELFGHEKGAFTGALNRKMGLVEAAHGGTLFLDEIGDVPLALQVKLLRLIESGTFRPVGSVEEKHSDFRLICATHKSIDTMVQEKSFRNDLYYRISPFPIQIPALRERRDDIPAIARHLLKGMNKGKHHKKLSKEAEEWLRQQEFPGNIRELRNLLERSTILADGNHIQLQHITPTTPVMDIATNNIEPTFLLEPIKSLVSVEADYLKQVSYHFQGNQRDLAKALGISERTLYRKLAALKPES